MEQLPLHYNAWKTCLERDCGITLTTSFVQERLTALQDMKDANTQRFVTCYGDPYRQQVLQWFQQWLQQNTTA